MRELAKSLMSYGWAVSVYGVQQMANLITMREGPAAKAEEIETLTAGIVGKMGSAARTAYVVGNNFQRAAVDLIPGGEGEPVPADHAETEGTPAGAAPPPAAGSGTE